MIPRPLAVLTLFFIAVSSVLVYPGRTYLLSDTQIYIPLFEHLRDNRLLTRDLLLEGAHLGFTIYDEVTLTLANLFRADFEWVLLGQQLLFRLGGAWGAFLIARSFSLGTVACLFVSGALWLGAFVYGPAIITTEYEPVPRGFAVPLTVLALGLKASGAGSWMAGIPLGVAFLYHAPAIWPVLLIALLMRDGKLLAAPAVSAMALVVFNGLQPGRVEAQPFFSVLETAHAHIQQLRAPYNWLYRWEWRYFFTFAITGPLAIFAAWRLREFTPAGVAPYFRWLPWVGFATVPASLVLQERLGWALLPQIQPMRALLYCHLLCQLLGLICAMRALREGRWKTAALWLIVPLSLAARGDFLSFTETKVFVQLLLLAAIAAGTWMAVQPWSKRLAPVLLASPWLFAAYGDGAAKSLETDDLRALSAWARQDSATDAMYLFPDLGRKPEPGIFRARAARAVYVCWKQGGQVNYFAPYAYKWHERWTNLLAKGHAAMSYEDLRRRGVDRIILTKDEPHEELQMLYRTPDGEYRVYSLR